MSPSDDQGATCVSCGRLLPQEDRYVCAECAPRAPGQRSVVVRPAEDPRAMLRRVRRERGGLRRLNLPRGEERKRKQTLLSHLMADAEQVYGGPPPKRVVSALHKKVGLISPPRPAPREHLKEALSPGSGSESTSLVVRRMVKRLPLLTLSLIFHLGVIFLLASILFVAAPKVKEWFAITLAASSEQVRLPQEFDPFGRESNTDDDLLLADRLLLDELKVSDHSETANELDLDLVRANYSLGAAPSLFGFRNAGGRELAVSRFGGSAGSEAAVEGGLEWLMRHQDDKGGWGLYWRHCGPRRSCGPGIWKEGTEARSLPDGTELARTYFETGITGLAALCYLGAGYHHRSGRYCDVVYKALSFLAERQSVDGSFRGGFSAQGYYHLYEQAIVALAFSEAHGMTRDEWAASIAQAGVDYLGRWIKPSGRMDMSVLGFVIMALKSADLAGLKVDEGLLAWCGGWIDGHTAEDGRVFYNPAFKTHGRTWRSMTAVGTFCRELLGYGVDHPEVCKGIALLRDTSTKRMNAYLWYYVSLATFHFGGEAWDAWNRKMRDRLVSLQLGEDCAAGSWDESEDRTEVSLTAYTPSRVYVTSMAILTLETYYRYLPLYRHADEASSLGRFEPEEGSFLWALELLEEAQASFLDWLNLAESAPQQAGPLASTVGEKLAGLLAWARDYEPLGEREEESRDRIYRAAAYRLSLLHYQSGEADKAWEVLSSAVSRLPEVAENVEFLKLAASVQLARARQFSECQEEEESTSAQSSAAACLQKVLELQPDQPLTLYRITGDLLYAVGDFSEAMDLYQQLLVRFAGELDQEGQLEELRTRTMLCQALLGRFEEAAEQHARLSGNDAAGVEEFLDWYVHYANQLFSEGEYWSAQEVFQSVLSYLETRGAAANDRTLLSVKVRLADCCYELGRYRDAITHLEQVLASLPDAVNLQERLAACLFHTEQYDRAAEAYAQVTQLTEPASERWWDAEYRLVESLLLSGEPSRALDLISILKALHPELGGEEWRRKFQALEERARR